MYIRIDTCDNRFAAQHRHVKTFYYQMHIRIDVCVNRFICKWKSGETVHTSCSCVHPPQYEYCIHAKKESIIIIQICSHVTICMSFFIYLLHVEGWSVTHDKSHIVYRWSWTRWPLLSSGCDLILRLCGSESYRIRTCFDTVLSSSMHVTIFLYSVLRNEWVKCRTWNSIILLRVYVVTSAVNMY